MNIEHPSEDPQIKHRIDPVEELMDDLRLPREAKYDFMKGLLNIYTDEELDDFVTGFSTSTPHALKRPRVHWDTVQDCIYVEFQTGVDPHRQRLDQNIGIDLDGQGNLVGVVVRNISQGVLTEGLPESRRIRGMLQRRGIQTSNNRNFENI